MWQSLMDEEYKVDGEPSIKLIIEIGGKSGTLRLSSIYGSFNYLADTELIANEVTKFYCPHCRENLATSDACNTCGAPMVSFVA